MYLRKPCSTHSVFHNFTSQSQVKSTLNIHWKDYWSSKTLATWCEELTHWKRPWCWERVRVGGKGGDRGWDDWMASPNEWTWVEQTLGDSEGRKPGVLQASCTVQELGLISWTVPNELLLHFLSMDSLFPLRRSSGEFSPVASVFLWRQHFAPSSMQQGLSRSWITGYYVKQRGKSVSRLIRRMPEMFLRWSRPMDVCWPAMAPCTWPGRDRSHQLLGNTLY